MQHFWLTRYAFLFVVYYTNIAVGQQSQQASTLWREEQGLELMIKKQVELQETRIKNAENTVTRVQDNVDAMNAAVQGDLRSLLELVRNGVQVIKEEMGGLRTEVDAARRAMEKNLEVGLKGVNNKVEELFVDMKGEMKAVKRQVHKLEKEFKRSVAKPKSQTIFKAAKVGAYKTDGPTGGEPDSSKQAGMNEGVKDIEEEELAAGLEESSGSGSGFGGVSDCEKTMKKEGKEIKKEMKILRIYQEETIDIVKELKRDMTRDIIEVREKVDELKLEMQNTREEVVNVKKTVDGGKEKLEHVRVQIISTKSGLQRLSDGMNVIKGETVGTKYQISLVQDQVNMVKYELIVVQDLVNVVKDHIKVSRHKVTTLSDRVKNVQHDVRVLKDSAKSVKSTLDGTKKEIRGIKGTAETKWKAVSKKFKDIREMKADLKTVKGNITCVRERVGLLRDGLDDIRQDVARVSEEVIGSLGETLGVHEAVVKVNVTMNERIERVRRQILQIEERSTGTKFEMTQINEGINDMKIEIGGLISVSEELLTVTKRLDTSGTKMNGKQSDETRKNDLGIKRISKMNSTLGSGNSNRTYARDYFLTKVMLKDIQNTLNYVKQELMVMKGSEKKQPTRLRNNVLKSRKTLKRELELLTDYGRRSCQQMMYVFSSFVPQARKEEIKTMSKSSKQR